METGKVNYIAIQFLIYFIRLNTVHCSYGPISIYCVLDLSFLTFHRATVKKSLTFRMATPSNSLLWDITLDMGADGVVAVVCQKKAFTPGKRQVCSIYFMSIYSIFLSCSEEHTLFYWVNSWIWRNTNIFFPTFCWLTGSITIKRGTVKCLSCKAHCHLSQHLWSKRLPICIRWTAAYCRDILHCVLGRHLLHSLS